MLYSTKCRPLDQLPNDILYSIFGHLDVQDIIRMRRVSRHLNTLSHSRHVWDDAYHGAEFVRPPGPFLTQSAHELEKVLVLGFRVDRNINPYRAAVRTTYPERKLGVIWYKGEELGVSLVFGRFLLVAFKRKVRCYDLDHDVFDSGTILYKPRDATLQSFHCDSAIDVNGRRSACMVLREEIQTDIPNQLTTRISIYSLKVTRQSKLMLDLLQQFSHSGFSIDDIDLGPRVLAVRGKTAGGYPALITWDVHTRTPLIPSPSVMRGLAQALASATSKIISSTCISTSKYLLLTSSFNTEASGSYTFVWALVLPHLTAYPHSISPAALNASHCSAIPGIAIPEKALLHDAVVEASTQDVLITIRVDASGPSKPDDSSPKYGVLRLSTTHTNHASKLGSITFRPLGSFPEYEHDIPSHPSFNGTGRAFYMRESVSQTMAMVEYNIHGITGDNDGGGNDDGRGIPRAEIKEYSSIVGFMTTDRCLLDYDPYSGRICLQPYPAKKNQVIEIFHFPDATVTHTDPPRHAGPGETETQENMCM